MRVGDLVKGASVYLGGGFTAPRILYWLRNDTGSLKMSIKTMNALLPRFALLVFVLAIGCSPTREAVKKSPEPYDTLTVGSLNVANLSRRIEKNDITRLARIIDDEGLHLLAIAGITRYPQVSTRVDLVDELTTRAGIYSAFGESATISGRQTGNAVFSVYPIRAQRTTHYEGLQSNTFESAFQAVIDCGLRDVAVISTRLPESASRPDISLCMETLASLHAQYKDYALIIAGNLPASPDPAGEFLTARAEGNITPLWYSNDGSLRLISQKSVKTPLGMMTVARLAIFRSPVP